jgi:hypothetical protein
MAEVWEHSRAAGTALLVQLALADHADEASRSCWPSLAHLARKTRVSPATVRRALRQLVGLGEVEVIRRGGGHSSARYHLRGYQSATPTNLQPVAPATPQGCQFATPGVAPVLPEPSRTTKNRRARAADRFADDFAAVWERYPRKLNRKGAHGAYGATRRRGVDAASLSAATLNFAHAMQGTAANFIMHGATFFGPNERWKDYLVAKTSGMVDVEPSAIDTAPAAAW